MFSEVGKIMLFAGLALAAFGLLITIASKAGATNWLSWFGNLPLDLRIEKENFNLYFPLGSMVLISLALNLLIYVFNKLFR